MGQEDCVPYTGFASTVTDRFWPTEGAGKLSIRNPWAINTIFLADHGHSAGPSFLKTEPNRAARTVLDSPSLAARAQVLGQSRAIWSTRGLENEEYGLKRGLLHTGY